MRLALLMHSVLPRGGVVHTLALADALVARGHRVSVIAPVEPGQGLFRSTRAQVELLPIARPTGGLRAQVGQRIDALVHGLGRLLAGSGFDLLHAQDSLNGNALATLAERALPLPPWVRTVHHLDAFDDPVLQAWQERAWRQAAAVGCVSDLWCRWFEAQPGRGAQRLYNGVDLQRFRPDGPTGHPRVGPSPYLLSLGGIEARKNTPRLLEAFARLRRVDPQAAGLRLVIAGGASLLDHARARADWQAALARHGLQDGPGEPVLHLGPVPDDEVPALLRGARLLAMPSLLEGFGLVALEALACATPVLVSQRPPFTEHLRDCASVVWCEPTSIASISAGLSMGLRRPRPQSLPEVCRRHDWRRSAEVHEAWYAQVLARQGVPV